MNKKSVPVYRNPAVYARENNELETYRASMALNEECRDAIEDAIRKNFDGMHLNKGCVVPVMEEYGPDRVSYVLACTVILKPYDGRFSPKTRQWADIMYTGRLDEMKDEAFRWMVDSHPAVLDGFIGFAADVIKEATKALTADDVEILGIIGEETSESSCPYVRETRLRVTVGGIKDVAVYKIVGHPLDDAEQTLYFEDKDDASCFNIANMSFDEWQRLCEKVRQAINYLSVKEEIDKAAFVYDLGNAEVSLWEFDEFDITAEQREKLYESLAKKRFSLSKTANEMAWALGFGRPVQAYLTVHRTDGGWDWTLYGADYAEIDGGVLDNESLTAEEVADDILPEYGFPADRGRRMVIDPEDLEAEVAFVEEQKVKSVIKDIQGD